MNDTKALCPNGLTRRGGKNSWENHYGDGKDFTTKENFLTWLYRKPETHQHVRIQKRNRLMVLYWL